MLRIPRIIFPLLALILAMSLAVPALAQPDKSRVLIGFHQLPRVAEENLVKQSGGDVLKRFHYVPVIAARLPQVAIERLSQDPRVAYIANDAEVYAVDDTLPWGVGHIDAELVHGAGVKGSGVKVAVIDTGIDRGHPDLVANIAGGRNFVGFFPFIDPNAWDDDHGHGTHVAGTVAADDNGFGVLGVAPDASLYGVKVLNANGSGYTSWVIAGIEWAIDNNMDIINMSLGTTSDVLALHDAVDAAYAYGIVVVAAAGNNYEGEDTVIYPAKYDTVIAVAATNSSDLRAPFSSTGPSVELAAPGDIIYSTTRGGGHGYMSGTSMATPHVSGTVALVIAAGISDAYGDGHINDDVRLRLQETAIDLGIPGRDTWYGFGRIDAYAAASVTPEPNEPPWVEAGGPYSGQEVSSVALSVTAGDPDGSIVKYEWDWDGNSVYDEVTASPVSSHTWSDDFVGSFVVRVTDDRNATATDSAGVTISNVSPTAEAGGPYSGVEGTPITLSASATDAGTDTFSYAWDLYGDALYETNGQIVSHTWAADGTYTVSLRVTDDNGGTDVDTATVEVSDAEPVASFDYSPENPLVGEPVSFADTSSSHAGIVSWNWQFGDSETSAETNPSHTYTEAGTYLATLTVAEADSDQSTVAEEIIVSDQSALPKMHVDYIDMSSESKSRRGTSQVRALATVYIVDALGQSVKRATVYGSWTGADTASLSATTKGDGSVTFKTEWVSGSGPYVFTFTVDKIVKKGWEYDPASDVETSDSITVP